MELNAAQVWQATNANLRYDSRKVLMIVCKHDAKFCVRRIFVFNNACMTVCICAIASPRVDDYLQLISQSLSI